MAQVCYYFALVPSFGFQFFAFMYFRAASKPLDEEASHLSVMCEDCGGSCLLVKHVSRCTHLSSSPVASTTEFASFSLGRVAEGAAFFFIVEPEEEFDASNSFLAQGLAADAPCALQWDKDRCIRYGPRLGEHMVSRYALAQSVVKCLPVEGKPI